MLELNYDAQFDTLYLSIEDNSRSYSSEVINNINIFRNLESDNVSGFLIFGFIKKYESGILQQINLPYHIDYENDVIPKIQI